MSAVLLAMLAVMPPQSVAPPQSVPEPAAIASIPDATGEPIVAVEPCQCGDVCECADCDCPGCPHRAVKDSLTPRPPLVITSAVAGCPPCERFKGDALPRLQAAGWVEGKHYTLRLVPLGSETVPTFAYRGETFERGYGGWSEWRAKLVTAMGEPERVTHEAQRHEVAKPVQAHHLSPGLHEREHSHVCGRCNIEWWHDGSGDHRKSHLCPKCGTYNNVISRWR